MNSEQWNQFEEGVHLILNSWTALRLAVENSWGGPNSLVKQSELAEDLVYWFTLNTKDPDVFKLEEQLLAALLEDFSTQVEDGSLYQVAQRMIDLYTECRNGKNELLKQLRSISQLPLGKQVCEEESSSTGDYDSDVMEAEEPKQQTEVDEDGFTIVRNRRR
eukprot:g7658.t1